MLKEESSDFLIVLINKEGGTKNSNGRIHIITPCNSIQTPLY